MPRVILHLAERAAWEEARGSGAYLAQSLSTEGFIHCSDPHQVVAEADALYRGRTDLVLLAIDNARLRVPIRYEAPQSGAERFPHVYGPIETGAVVDVFDFPPGPDGRFRLPFRTLPRHWYETDDDWLEAERLLLETAYLSAEDIYGESGFRGDADRWRLAREPIVAAIHKDGALLDVGCANGLLMESVVTWAAERGLAIEPFGLDLSTRLAELARRRLPEWSDRIFVGNGLDWTPPRRFDFVRTELEYVPPDRRRGYVSRLLRDVLAPQGRLIVCSYGSARLNRPAQAVGDVLRSWGHTVIGETDATEGRSTLTRVAWIEAP